MRILKLLFLMFICGWAVPIYGQSIAGYEYWVDESVDKKTSTATNNNEIDLNVDVSELEEGIHRFIFRAVDNEGRWSAPASMYFYHAKIKPSLAKYEYWFDEMKDRKSVDLLDATELNISLDIRDLQSGLHRLCFRTCDTWGRWSSPTTSYFIKTPKNTDNNSVVGYEYWFNDATSTAIYTEVEPAATLSLNPALLDVNSTQPGYDYGIFFKVDEKGDAHVYLKDTKVTVRFKDSNGQWSSPEVGYFSYMGGQTVEAEELENDTILSLSDAKNFWYYKYEASKGDRLDLIASEACDITVYDPFGVVASATYNQESKVASTITCQRNGSYYIVVNNVLNYSEITCQFTRGCAVFGTNTRKVGNSGYFNLVISGNGFTNQTDVSLTRGETCLRPSMLTVLDRTRLKAAFELDDCPCGWYDLVTSFGIDNDIVLKNQIEIAPVDTSTVQPLIVSIIGTGQYYMRGGRSLFNVNVKNPRNTTTRPVDVSINFDVQDFGNVSQLRFLGEMNDLCGNVTEDEFAGGGELLDLIREYLNADDEMRSFIAYEDAEGQKHLTCDLIIPEMAPNSTLEIPITCVMEGTPILRANAIEATDNKSPDTPPSKKEKCCEQLLCYFNIVASALGLDMLYDPICALDLAADMGWQFAKDLGCGSDDNEHNSSWIPKKAQDGGGSFDDRPFVLNKTMVLSYVNCVIQSVAEDMVMEYLVNSLLKITNPFLGNAVKTLPELIRCFAEKNLWGNCGDEQGGTESEFHMVFSYDPNAKYGYRSPSGSTFYGMGVEEMNYTIEFENDPEKALIAAHDVYVTDTLDASVFDLSSFRAKSVMVGSHFEPVDFECQNYEWDIDMRPDMELITRVKLNYDQQKGVAHWHFASIDPATDEPTQQLYGGFLPPNENGNGVGRVSFSVKLKENLPEGTKVNNDAIIVFDYNDPITTPQWTNVKDVTPPISSMIRHTVLNDSLILLKWEGSDEASGIWKYDIYVQQGALDPWVLVASDLATNEMEYRVYDNIYYSFCCVATDMAGNKEEKMMFPEDTYYKSGSTVWEVDYGKQFLMPGSNVITILNAVGCEFMVTDIAGRVVGRQTVDSNEYDVSMQRGTYIILLRRSNQLVAKAKVTIK